MDVGLRRSIRGEVVGLVPGNATLLHVTQFTASQVRAMRLGRAPFPTPHQFSEET